MHNEFRADIHCHSTCSDGSDAPLDLLQKAKDAGLQGLSITDHDTVDAYTPQFFDLAAKLKIAILTGVEISSELDDTSVHILGYGYDLNQKGLRQFLSLMQEKRTERNRAILKKLTDRKMPITEEELKNFAKLRTIGRPHIAQLMVHKGYVATIRDAFDKYLKEGALCFATGLRFHPKEVIEEIRKAGGKAVLAHPHFIKKGSFLRKLLDLPFDGIECYYSRLDKALEIPWLKIAKERSWIPTGGSDYHGAMKPHIPLGCSWVSEHIFNLLNAPRSTS
ncbi:MAG: PHP domain-containing protein [Parachlamydiales bacterium]|nr:PHP domain-containing protein [Parachlamydiales bacterium]